MPERIDLLAPNPFLNGPGDYLARYVALELGKVKQWQKIFGEFIDGYMRMDYDIRNLPVIRFYSDGYTMESDNWFVVGNLTCDLILPPSIRRTQLQTLPDILTSALVQQFRRQPFFTALRALVPGLNYLGQSIKVDKNLAFQYGQEGKDLAPMAQATINFRVDLREWDLFLESDNRTVDDPFDRTLADLDLVAATIDGLTDDGSGTGTEVPVQITT